MGSFITGFALSFSLILAIGPQNAFVLRQGLQRQHVFAVCLFCGVSDALLILAGVAGLGALAAADPTWTNVLRWGGAAFLFWYGAKTAISAFQGGQAQELHNSASTSRSATLATLAALTWLNPHVYLDTIGLIGAVSAQSSSRVHFGAGAVLASVTFFFLLGYGARFLLPLFRNPRAWQVFDGGVALTMWIIAVGLILA